MIVWKRTLNGNSNALVWPNLTNTDVSFVDWKSNQSGSFNWSTSVLFNNSTSLLITNTYTMSWLWKTATLPTSWNLYNFFIKWRTTTALNWFDCALYNNSWTYQLYITHANNAGWTSYFWNIPTPVANTYYHYALMGSLIY